MGDAGRGRRGFSLVESLVSLLILSLLMIGLLTLLDSSTRLAKQETQVADAQASSRAGIYELSRVLRQARAGQVSPLISILPVVNNASDASPPAFTALDGSARTVRPGTDVIEVRGILFDQEYYLAAADVLCASGPCSGDLSTSTTVTVTLRQQVPSSQLDPLTGLPIPLMNWDATVGRPGLASRTLPFFFIVSSSLYMNANPLDPTTPLSGRYVVGRVTPPGTGYTFTPGSNSSFTFSMVLNPADADCMALMARTGSATVPAPQKAYFGGALDDVVFFVDRGQPDPGEGNAFTRPVLAMGTRSAAVSGRWDVQPIVDGVEDLQFAYGLDGAKTASATDWNSAWGTEVTPEPADGGVDPVRVSKDTDADEWVLDAPGEGTGAATNRIVAGQASYPQFLRPGNAPAFANPSLRAVLIGIVAKSADPDVKFDGPGAWGARLFDSTAAPVLTGRPYRRRVQTMAVLLRNSP